MMRWKANPPLPSVATAFPGGCQTSVVAWANRFSCAFGRSRKRSTLAMTASCARSRAMTLSALHRGVALEKERLGECHALDLARVHALVGRVDQRLRFLDPHQDDLRVGIGLCEHVAERNRPAL